MLLSVLLAAALAPSVSQQQQEVRADPVCSAEVRWAVSGPQATGRAQTDTRTFTLFSAVAQPSCLPAEIRLTVGYFDAASELVCGGTVTNIALQQDATQLTTLQFQLTNLSEWVRWRSGPHDVSLQTRSLSCLNFDGTGPVAQAALDRAVSMRLYVTILSGFRGMATDELQIAIAPRRADGPRP